MSNDDNTAPDSAEVLESRRITLRVAGRELTITPITLGEMQTFARAARPVFVHLREADRAGANDVFLFDLFELCTAEMAALVALGARVDLEWLMSLSLEDAARVGEAVLAVNQDFFVRRLLPMLGAMRAAGAPTTGATQSSGSPAPDSGSAT